MIHYDLGPAGHWGRILAKNIHHSRLHWDPWDSWCILENSHYRQAFSSEIFPASWDCEQECLPFWWDENCLNVSTNHFLSGGTDGSSYFNSILSYNRTEESWQLAGYMSVPRYLHAVEVTEDVSQHCPWWRVNTINIFASTFCIYLHFIKKDYFRVFRNKLFILIFGRNWFCFLVWIAWINICNTFYQMSS